MWLNLLCVTEADCASRAQSALAYYAEAPPIKGCRAFGSAAKLSHTKPTRRRRGILGNLESVRELREQHYINIHGYEKSYPRVFGVVVFFLWVGLSVLSGSKIATREYLAV